MKLLRPILPLISLLLPLAAFADTIVLQDATTIEAYNVEEAGRWVLYTTEASEEAPVQRIAIDKVFAIKTADGNLRTVGTPQAAHKAEAPKENPAQNAVVASFPDAKANSGAKSRIAPASVKYVGKGEDKAADEILLLYMPSEESVLADANLEVVVRSAAPEKGWKGWSFYNPNVAIDLINRTAKTIYIDLGNTFFICDGSANRYYTPSATTTTASSSTGLGVNLGAVAGAFGIGGAVGTLATGINIGGSQGSSESTTTFAERVLAIPPKSLATISGAEFPEPEKIKNSGLDYGCAGTYGVISYQRPKESMMQQGEETTDFDKSIFPKISVLIAYGLDENISSPVTLASDFVPYKMMGGKYRKKIDLLFVNPDEFSKDINDCLLIWMNQRKAKK